jgi:hypothetical protein
MFTNPWAQPVPPKAPITPWELLLDRLSNGVPPDIACRAAGFDWATIKDKPEVDKALAEGEVLLFERARDSGVTGVVRAAMRREANSWLPKAEPTVPGGTLEDLLRD